MKPTWCTNFSNLFLEWNSTCFGQFPCPSSGAFHCTHSNGICHTGLLTACEQDQDVPSWSCSQAVSKPVWHIPLLCVQRKTPDDGQGYCPKHVEFHSENKFEKLMHLVGFIIRNLSRCMVTWTYQTFCMSRMRFAQEMVCNIVVVLQINCSQKCLQNCWFGTLSQWHVIFKHFHLMSFVPQFDISDFISEYILK